MARKLLKAQRALLVVNPKPLEEDEADYLISKERQRSGSEIPFGEFLKRHPRNVEMFVKRHGRQPGLQKIRLLSQAAKEYEALTDAARAAALAVMDELAENPFRDGASAMRGHASHYRVRFYRYQYRMVYSLSKSKLVVTRIRRKGEKTYLGYEPQAPSA